LEAGVGECRKVSAFEEGITSHDEVISWGWTPDGGIISDPYAQWCMGIGDDTRWWGLLVCGGDLGQERLESFDQTKFANVSESHGGCIT
jgi:hypothetical protein